MGPHNTPIKSQDPQQRVHNFSEVCFGFTEPQAVKEALRCLDCKKPRCVEGCPVCVDIPGFIRLIKEKRFLEAAARIKQNNFFPAVCGRVCPQENQCEKACILAAKDQAIDIGSLERFVADVELSEGKRRIAHIKEKGSKVAVVGSGPSGLTCAGELRKKGYGVTVFEALHELGGVMVYGIPEFRLPKRIVEKEIEYLKTLGVEFKVDHVIGKTYTLDELLKEQGYSAIYIAIGAGSPSFLHVPGEELNFVYSANEFLTRINLMKAYQFPLVETPVWVGKRVAVIGGGNTAMDAARCARRLGPEKVYLLYRRSREEMPARIEEVAHAEEEGIEFHLLVSPLAFGGDAAGYVKEVVLGKMRLTDPDESGRRTPVLIPNSEYTLAVDSVVVAIGAEANPLLPSTEPLLTRNKWGYIVIDSQGRTSLPYVYAGGDIVTGSATVIQAMGQGKQIAEVIDTDLKKD